MRSAAPSNEFVRSARISAQRINRARFEFTTATVHTHTIFIKIDSAVSDLEMIAGEFEKIASEPLRANKSKIGVGSDRYKRAFSMRKKAKYKEWHEKGVRASETGELEHRVRTELWDLIHHITVKIIIDKLALKGNETVFDVGCGWSRIILGIKKYFPEMNIHGIELSEAIYKKGVELAEQYGFGKISIQNGDVLKIDLPEEKYDAIYSTRVIHYLEDEEKQIVIQKIYSMLKSGGKVLIIIPNSYCPYRFFTYKHAPLYPIKRICLALEENKFRNVTWGSYGFIPPWKRFTWDNQFMKLELLLEKIPFVNLMGGLVYAYAEK